MKKLILLLAPVAALLITGCSQVDSDQAGFKTWFGKPDTPVLGPGLYGISPIGGNMVKYPIRDMRADVTMQAYTKDMQQAAFKVAVIYAPDRSRLIELHTKYGKDYALVIIEPAVASAVKDVVGQWEADQLVNGREKATAAIRDKTAAALNGTPVLLKSLSVMNIDYSDAFEKAIEEKVVQQQSAIKAKNKTVQVEEEARQKTITARAEAEAISIRAKALAENKDVVILNAIEKWDGHAPQTLVIGADGKIMLQAK